MPNLNPGDARTYNPAPTLWKYDPQATPLGSRSTSTSSPSQSTTPAQPDLSTDSRAWPIWANLTCGCRRIIMRAQDH
jgi:hypothetical protein